MAIPHDAEKYDRLLSRRPAESVLTEEMLARFASRAPPTIGTTASCKKISRNFGQRSILLLPLPKEFGGAGMTLAEMCREQTAVGVSRARNCAGSKYAPLLDWVAADLWRRGDTSLEWILREAAAGEIFAAGHAESGNDVPVLLSTSKAERVEGGYKFTGRKLFGSLMPVWTRFGLHGMDTSDPNQPKIVHAFMPRDTAGYTIKEDLGCSRYACHAQ